MLYQADAAEGTRQPGRPRPPARRAGSTGPTGLLVPMSGDDDISLPFVLAVILDVCRFLHDRGHWTELV